MTRIKLPLKTHTSGKSLEVGKAYYLKNKSSETPEFLVGSCKGKPDGIKTILGFWTHRENPVLFNKFEVVGPIPTHKEICELAGMRTDGTFLPAEISPLS